MNSLLVEWLLKFSKAFRISGDNLLIVILLALGMGGVAAFFMPAYSLLYAPLPFPQPDQLVRVGGSIPLFKASDDSFVNRELMGRIFSNITAYVAPANSRIKARIPDMKKDVDARILQVSEEFFETFGVQPVRGYGFRNKENNEIVVSHRFWQKELLGTDDVIGKTILIRDNAALLIVGVMPEYFDFPAGTDFWRNANGGWSNDTFLRTQFVGRLRSGVSSEQAASYLESLEFEYDPYYANTFGGIGPVLQSLTIVFHGDQFPLILILGTLAGLFLLLVCVGVANYQIARGIRRKSEMALRMAFGATRWRLICQLMYETLPLALMGGAAGLVLAGYADIWLQKQFPTLKGGEVAFPVVIVFFAALVIVVTIVSSLIPAFRTTNVELNTLIKSSSGSKRRFFSSREVLVGVQLSITLALLIGSGVLVRSMRSQIDSPAAWSPQNKIMVLISTPRPKSPEERARRMMFYQDAQRQLEQAPGVLSVGSLYPVPLTPSAKFVSESIMPSALISKDKPSSVKEENQPLRECLQGTVSSNGFDLLGIPLLLGRPFSETETIEQSQTDRKVIINRTLAEYFWPGENAVGKVFYDGISSWNEIVGVVSDFHLVGNSNIVRPMFFRPAFIDLSNPNFIVKLHPSASLANFQTNARRLLTDLNADVWLEVRTMQEHVLESTTNKRLTLNLITCFALMGIVVSGLGMYATLAWMVSLRTKEIGIRMAVGAKSIDILRLILLRSGRVLLIGFPCGLFGGWVLARELNSVLFQVRPNDPIVWIISCLFLTFIVIVAALVPALRAIRVSPMDALRGK